MSDYHDIGFGIGVVFFLIASLALTLGVYYFPQLILPSAIIYADAVRSTRSAILNERRERFRKEYYRT